ncbi:MAG: LysR family transcriptional regulator [Alphaproteobacteria bacterium]|nr:LysR family transcriptional regulator [Alphaproteobacteria bacterium]
MTDRPNINMRILQTFVVVARHGSITRAAEELNLTQSAVSHQLQKLTEDLGEKLVTRAGRGVALTEAGRKLAENLDISFRDIERHVQGIVGEDRSTVRLAVCSSFAPGWLIQRLHSFIDTNPSIDLQLRMYAADPELTDTVADAFVTTYPSQPGFWAVPLRREMLIAVRAATGRSRTGGVPLPLITTWCDDTDFASDWKAYGEATGQTIETLGSGRWLQCTHYVLALEMARHGLGIALVPDFLAEGLISKGELERLGNSAVATHEDYYLCVKNARRREQPLQAVVSWFKGQIASAA